MSREESDEISRDLTEVGIIVRLMKKVGPAEMREEFGRRLRLARLAAGYKTARAFATKLEIDENSYTPYERGRSFPQPLTLARIKHLTGVTMDWLFLGDVANLPLRVHEALEDARKRLSQRE